MQMQAMTLLLTAPLRRVCACREFLEIEMTLQILRAADYKQVPWKNGGGVTREVFVSWLDTRHLEWGWRVSIATVAASGPFSNFPNVDRSIAVLDGNGMKLSMPNEPTVSLEQNSEPYAFSGEAAVTCEVHSGVTTDLNVMTLRNKFRHSLRKGFYDCQNQSCTNIIIANENFSIVHNGENQLINRFDALMWVGNCNFSIPPEVAPRLFQIRIVPL